jgi:ATP-dependent helicase Lhr and Lhr-like helicase
MHRRLRLASKLGAREPQRLAGALTFGIDRGAPGCAAFLCEAFIHPLLQPRVRIDESFSGITHINYCSRMARDPLTLFHPAVAEWFRRSFARPTAAQAQGWPAIARGESTLLFAPTGSGKTLAAFLWCINRLMFDADDTRDRATRTRVIYVSPLKALAVDVDRNLRAPIAGIGQAAEAGGHAYRVPAIAIRTGDTPASERARLAREPADILITTPESLFLVLTSNPRETLRGVDTVIVDEIHAMVPTKRGSHLALSLERLEHLVKKASDPSPSLQRIGLSATQRPLDEVARFLGGTEARRAAQTVGTSLKARAADSSRKTRRATAGLQADPVDHVHGEFGIEREVQYRPVTIVDTGERKRLELRVEVPVEDMARLGEPDPISSGSSASDAGASIWTAIHPRLLEHVRAHRSTIIFVNSRRIAERLASALNEVAGETIARAHHGSLARAQRLEIEDQLKAGRLPALVATSSLELGIDMGAVDLVIQIEAPPSIASGMQRIGRAGHQVGEASRGVIFPKYRGDLVASATVTRAMHEGRIEPTRYPRNPLDVLAQQVVAMVALEEWNADDLFGLVRRAAPFATLAREAFDGILDMLSGRYPSDDFAELRPRLTWDRVRNRLTAREGAKRIAVTNAGTIPDRGLYGVFLAGADARTARVGELDEEMVFESRVGETFLLGASSWRIEEMTHDRVLVSAAPGQPGKMPFWKGDAAGRPLELGRSIGALVRSLRAMPAPAALERLTSQHDLDRPAAENLLAYLRDQAASGAVPDDRTLVVERSRDELGEWRICLLSPFGGRIHAPWSMAAGRRIRQRTGLQLESMWTDDGFVIRFPETDEPPDPELLVPGPEEVEELVLGELGMTSLFATRFREAAARALLLPRRRPGGRTPLWQQRKRAADLLAVASRFGSFPILLETYRECLRDVFDMPALVATLRQIRDREIRMVTLDLERPSPFAASLLFGYVANFLYDGDAPLAERRAQALSIDQAQLRQLVGEAELRELLDAEVVDEVERQRQQLEPRSRVRSADGVHDLLLRLGDLTRAAIEVRAEGLDVSAAIASLVRERRGIEIDIGGAARLIPVEYASRYRDALGVSLPAGLPDALLAAAADAAGDLARRYARTHGPFTTSAFATHYGMPAATAAAILGRLLARGQLVEGEFKPHGTEREWCDPEVLQAIRRRSLAKLRRQVSPVEPAALGRLVTTWQGIVRPRRGLDALLDVIETLQGASLPASLLEREILPARIEGYEPGDLDTLASAGEIAWVGVGPLGERDGRVALYLTDALPRLLRPTQPASVKSAREEAILAWLASQGASFFAAIHGAAGGGYPGETVGALWALLWQGVVTNDTFHALRAYTRAPERRRRVRLKSAHDSSALRPAQGAPSPSRGAGRVPFRSRRLTPPAAEGRWSAVAARVPHPPTPTEWSAAVAEQLLARYGIVTREVAAAEDLPGGFSAVYEVFRALEDRGRIRRGYFVSGVGAMQFAQPAAVEMLRSLAGEPEEPEVVTIAATDPANPYGSLLRWPGGPADIRGATRSVGATVILIDGALAAWIARAGRQILVWLPEDEPARSRVGRSLAVRLADLARDPAAGGLLVGEINNAPAADHPLAPYLLEAGFTASALGYQIIRRA